VTPDRVAEAPGLSPVPVARAGGRFYRHCLGGHAISSDKSDLSDLTACPAMVGTIHAGVWQPGSHQCGREMGGWEIEPPPLVERIRDSCCRSWPKPCSYHEGWRDGYEYAQENGTDG
jgi:hypothetical protein